MERGRDGDMETRHGEVPPSLGMRDVCSGLDRVREREREGMWERERERDWERERDRERERERL